MANDERIEHQADELIRVHVGPGPLFALLEATGSDPAKIVVRGFRPREAGGSPLERAGVSVGDQVITFDGLDLSSLDSSSALRLVELVDCEERILEFRKGR